MERPKIDPSPPKVEPPPEPASSIPKEESQKPGDGKHANLTLGVNYIFLTATLQIHLYHGLAVSGGATYYSLSSRGGSFKGPGGFGALNYYGDPSFGGLWIQAGAGAGQFQIDLNGIEQIDSTFVLASIGWRWKLKSSFNFGFGVGTTYLFKTKDTIDLGLSGFLPLIVMDLGVAF